MLQKITDPKKIRGLILLFSLTYFISYITRINYGAVISEMEQATQLTLVVWLIIALFGTVLCLVCIKPWHQKMDI